MRCSAHTVKHSDFLPPFPRCFVSFAARYRRCALGFAPADIKRSIRGPGIFTGLPNRVVRRRRQDLPGSWRTLYERAVLSTPVGPPRSATAALRYCLPPNGRRRLPRQILISGLNHTARTLAVYASQDGLLHRHARLASGGWPTLPCGTAYRPGPIERFQVISSSFPRLRLAHPILSIEVGHFSGRPAARVKRVRNTGVACG